MGVRVAVLISLLLASCGHIPPPIPLGDIVSPPKGCIDMRTRGGNC